MNTHPFPSISQVHRLPLPKGMTRALIFSQVMAIVWWAVSLAIDSLGKFVVWNDQMRAFRAAAAIPLTPYEAHFLNPPWAVLFVWPFAQIPLAWGVLAQTMIYFAALVGVIYKFGGGMRAVVLMLSSYFAFAAVFELNIEWIVIVGLLLPPLWGVPLVLAKPQLALTYYLGLPRQTFVRAVIVGLVTLLISFAVWGWWPPLMFDNTSRLLSYHVANIAPQYQFGWLFSLAIGIPMLGYAFYKRDTVLLILAWLFFVPYIGAYSILLHVGFASIKWPRVMLVIVLVTWVIYGSSALRFILT